MDLIKSLWKYKKEVSLMVLLGIIIFVIVWALLNTLFTVQRRAREPMSCGQECYRCQLADNVTPAYPYKLTFQAGSTSPIELNPPTVTVRSATDPNYIERCFDPAGGVIVTTCTSEKLPTDSTALGGGGGECTYSTTISVFPQQCEPTITGVTPGACACDKDGGILTCNESFSADEGIKKWNIQWTPVAQPSSSQCAAQFQCDHINLFSSVDPSKPYATIAPCPPASTPAEVRIHQSSGASDREYTAQAVNPQNTPMPECKTCNTKYSCPATCLANTAKVVGGQCDDGCDFNLTKACSQVGDKVNLSLVGFDEGFEYWVHWDDIDSPNPEQIPKSGRTLSHVYNDGGIYQVKLECRGDPQMGPCIKQMSVMCGGGETPGPSPTPSPTPTPEACIPLEFVPLKTVCQDCIQ